MSSGASRAAPQFDPFVALCKEHGLPAPVKEFTFASDRKYRADYCWPDEKLIVEKDGGTWSTGGHSTGQGIQRDMAKSNLAQLLGYKFLRYTPQQLTHEDALAEIRQALGVSG